MGDMREFFEPYKVNHKIRVSQTPKRLEYACRQLDEAHINYKVCNHQTGQINCMLHNRVIVFYAGTGKIVGFNNLRGTHALVDLCKKSRKESKHNG